MQKSRAFRFNLLFFHLSKKNKRISTAIAHATRDIVMLEIKIIQIIIPLIFAIGIIAIIYTFLKEPRIILGDLFSAIYFRIKEEFFGFLLIPFIPFIVLYLIIFKGGRLKKEDYQGDLKEKKSAQSAKSVREK